MDGEKKQRNKDIKEGPNQTGNMSSEQLHTDRDNTLGNIRILPRTKE